MYIPLVGLLPLANNAKHSPSSEACKTWGIGVQKIMLGIIRSYTNFENIPGIISPKNFVGAVVQKKMVASSEPASCSSLTNLSESENDACSCSSSFSLLD